VSGKEIAAQNERLI